MVVSLVLNSRRAGCRFALFHKKPDVFGFQPLPPMLLAMFGGIVLSYMMTAEWVKRIFYRYYGR
jgi:hypothetical protein